MLSDNSRRHGASMRIVNGEFNSPSISIEVIGWECSLPAPLCALNSTMPLKCDANIGMFIKYTLAGDGCDMRHFHSMWQFWALVVT